MGRPKLDIDPRQVFRMAKYHCKDTEIADVLGCSVDTLTNRFSDELTKGRAVRKMGIRRAQIYHALKGNAALLIWLGKVMLDQTEHVDIAITENDRLSADPIAAEAALVAANATTLKRKDQA